MSELHDRQPTGGTGARPHGQTTAADPCGGDVTGYNTGLAGPMRPRVGAAEADDAARITDGGTTCEGPLVGDGTKR